MNWQVKLQLWRCYSEGLEELRCRFVPVQDKKDSTSCVFFATKFADEIAEGRDPQTGSFDKKDLRGWFISSFEANKAQIMNRRRGAKATLDHLGTSFSITPVKNRHLTNHGPRF